MGQSPEEMTALAASENFPLEFSSALPYHPEMELIFRNYPHPKLVHNYFPAPIYPFVLNLASADPIVRTESIAHCLKGLRWSRLAGAKFYCAHAGFCIDPRPDELGQKIKQGAEKIDREKHWNIFLDSVRFLVKMADELCIDFYIENNVTAEMNLNVHGQNPLLCSDPEEMNRLIEEVNHSRLGILLDTAHLKVSANTLNFDKEAGVKLLEKNIKAIHHSDNEGLLDNNQLITRTYWFLPFMPNFINIPHVLEVKKQTVDAINVQLRILRSAVN